MENRNDLEEMERNIENAKQRLIESAETLREIEESQQETRRISRQLSDAENLAEVMKKQEGVRVIEMYEPNRKEETRDSDKKPHNIEPLHQDWDSIHRDNEMTIFLSILSMVISVLSIILTVVVRLLRLRGLI